MSLTRAQHACAWRIRGQQAVWCWAAAVGVSVWSHGFAGGEQHLSAAVAALAIAALLGTGAHLVSGRLSTPHTPDRKRGVLPRGWVRALLAGAVITAAIPVPPAPPPWHPVCELTLTALGQKNPASSSSEVWVEGLHGDGGEIVEVDEFENDGRWEIRGNAAVSYLAQPAELKWRGRLEGGCRLFLRGHGWSGMARVRWNGAEQVVDLYAPEVVARQVALPGVSIQGFGVPVYRALVFASDAVALGGLLWLAGWWLSARPARGAARIRVWPGMLLYGGVCAAAWTLCLLAYWPALMTSDSFDQWEQVLTGEFWNEHPAFGTLLMWSAARIWPTPAVAGLLQVPALSLVCGWGIAQMRRMGAPRWLAGLTCALVALSPVNAPMVVTFWKDVLFSTAMLWLGLLALKAVHSQGEWLEAPAAWLALGAAAAFTTLLRHNGIVPAGVTLALLLAAYRCRWRGMTAAVVCTVLLVGAVKGGLYRLMHVHPSRIHGWIYLPMHEIGAHVAAGTPILAEERPVLRRLRDAEHWPYSPYYVNPLLYDGHFSYERAQQNGRQAMHLALRLARRDPRVSLHRMIAVSSFVWRIRQPHDSIYWASLGGRSAGEVIGMSPLPNRFGLVPQPVLPSLRDRIADLVTASTLPNVAWLFWRPALYLYLLVAGTAVAVRRSRDWRYWIVAAPALSNSAIIALMTPAQDFRYQYGVYLTGLLLAPFLLWAAGRVEPAVLAGPGARESSSPLHRT